MPPCKERFASPKQHPSPLSELHLHPSPLPRSAHICRGEPEQCGYENFYAQDSCARCGTFRFDREAEISARVAALLQTCDTSTTTLRHLVARMEVEGGYPHGGVCITAKELQTELDRQLAQRGPPPSPPPPLPPTSTQHALLSLKPSWGGGGGFLATIKYSQFPTSSSEAAK